MSIFGSPPPSSVTGPLGSWLNDLWRHLNVVPRISDQTFASDPNSLVSGIPGDLLVNRAQSAVSRLWQLGGTGSAITNRGWLPISTSTFTAGGATGPAGPAGPAGTGGSTSTLSWIAPSLLNGWVNNVLGYQLAGFSKDSAGIGRVRGQVASGVGAIGTDVFVLPSGYRPQATERYAISDGANAIAQIDIYSTGSVRINTALASPIQFGNFEFDTNS